MKIDFNKVITTLDGEPFTVEGKPLIVAEVVNNCLLGIDEEADGAKKMERFTLSLKIHAAIKDKKPVDITTEQIATIKQLVGRQVMPLICGRIYELIENG